jgi:hypothetical protein
MSYNGRVLGEEAVNERSKGLQMFKLNTNVQ